MKNYDYKIDRIRCVAVFCVLSVHFFLNNGFYDEIVVGKWMFLGVFMRTFFMTCVPLFLIITGFLYSQKKVEISYHYYKRIIPTVIIPYVIISFFILLFKKIYLNETFGTKDAMLNILGYKQYSWYVNMYIGLFLMIPFINLVWQNIELKREKQILVITFLAITSLPSLFNINNVIIPNWWIGIYPITYYFLGAYIKEYPLKISTYKIFIMLVICTLSFSCFNYIKSYESKFIWGGFNDWGGFENTVDTVLLFQFLYSLKIKKNLKIVSLISKLSFGIYIASYISDKILYTFLNSLVPVVTNRFKYYIVIVPIGFIMSLVISCIAYIMQKLITGFLSKILKVERM